MSYENKQQILLYVEKVKKLALHKVNVHVNLVVCPAQVNGCVCVITRKWNRTDEYALAQRNSGSRAPLNFAYCYLQERVLQKLVPHSISSVMNAWFNLSGYNRPLRTTDIGLHTIPR